VLLLLIKLLVMAKSLLACVPAALAPLVTNGWVEIVYRPLHPIVSIPHLPTARIVTSPAKITSVVLDSFVLLFPPATVPPILALA